MIRFNKGGVTVSTVTPPGQSGFIAADESRAPHYNDQLRLYEDFGCRIQAFYPEDVEKAAVTRQTLTLK